MWRSPLNIVFKGGPHMSHYSTYCKELLSSIIENMADRRHEFVNNPTSDFTRNGKCMFIEYITFLCTLGGGKLSDELLDFYDFQNSNRISVSALCQARQKFKLEASTHLFHSFTAAANNSNKTFKGYKLYAVDGSTLPIYRNPNEPTGTFQPGKDGYRGFNALHLNAAYDVLNHIYLDITMQPYTKRNERTAFIELVKSFTSNERFIYLADRGYESYNNIAHVVENNKHFLIRAKDIHSNGIASSLNLPKSGTFDQWVSCIITKSRSKLYKNNPKIKRLSRSSPFDFIDDEHPTYPIDFRVVRIELDHGGYELLLTNLPKNKFKPSDLKDLYSLRWGIETSFRELKYTVGAMNLHSKKVDLIKQEIFFNLLMYNFTRIITNNTLLPEGRKKDKLYNYHLNFSVAVTVCRRLIKSLAFIRPPEDVEAILTSHLEPDRPGRLFKRLPQARRSWISFSYRVA